MVPWELSDPKVQTLQSPSACLITQSSSYHPCKVTLDIAQQHIMNMQEEVICGACGAWGGGDIIARRQPS